MGLVVSREVGEKVVVTLPGGARMEVIVGEIHPGKVKLCFQAPREVAIHRSEIQDRIDAEQAKRVESAP